MGSEPKHFRSFAVLCYVKAIKHLDPYILKRHLNKLIGMIVLQGLKTRELNYREKARKSLLKILIELGPNFIEMVFDHMRNLLLKGFQEHVYLFSMHWLLSGLKEKGMLKSNWVTGKLIETNLPIIMSELYGELNETKTNE